MANGQDWTDTLDARAAGKVLGFSESGAPIDTADVPPGEREVLDVQFFAAVEPPPTADPRDAKIAELEAQLRAEQDRRIAELETAIADAQTTPPVVPASSTAPAAPVGQLAETAPAAPVTTSTTTPAAPDVPPPPTPTASTPAATPGDVPPASDAAATAEAQGAPADQPPTA